jgi:hypothetical protein
MSFSVSAIELAEIGITLTASKTTELVHMCVNKKGNLFAELSLAPLSLDYTRASVLLNMAALELCVTSDRMPNRGRQHTRTRSGHREFWCCKVAAFLMVYISIYRRKYMHQCMVSSNHGMPKSVAAIPAPRDTPSANHFVYLSTY